MGKTWLTDEQRRFLEPKLPEFREAQSNSEATAFVGRVYTMFVERWPIAKPSDPAPSKTGDQEKTGKGTADSDGVGDQEKANEGTADSNGVGDKSKAAEGTAGNSEVAVQGKGCKKKGSKGKADEEEKKPVTDVELRLVSTTVIVLQ